MENPTIQFLLSELLKENTITQQCRDSIEQARVLFWNEVDRLKVLKDRQDSTFDALRFTCEQSGVSREDALNAYHNMVIHAWLESGFIQDPREIEVEYED